MFEIIETETFVEWFEGLRDRAVRAKIAARIRRMAFGNFGDVKSVGEGISELRIHQGPGYRIYFAQRDKLLVLILCGGDKASQKKDIATAKLLAKEPL